VSRAAPDAVSRAAPYDVEVRPVRTPQEREDASALRFAVFVDEQGVPAELEVDEHDATATHLVAVRDGRVVGTCRLVPDGDALRLGRLVVARDARGRGVATRLLERAEHWGRERGARRMRLAAQTHACALYESVGYQRRGIPFDEAGLEHVRMERELAEGGRRAGTDA
jgi:predicted GNAT family N-acyltransferase